MTRFAFRSTRRSLRRAAFLLVSTAILGTAVLGAPGDAAAQKADSKRGSFAERVGSALRNQAPNADRSKAPAANRPTANRPVATRSNGPQTRQGAVPAPRPLPSQRLGALAPAKPAASAPTSCLLQSSRKVGSADVVEISLEASGDVVQTTFDGQTERAPMEVVAGFKYEERYERYSPVGPVRSIRQYEQAGMKRKFGASVARPLLDASRKFIVSDFDGKKTTLYSPVGAMKSEQYSLLSELPFNTVLLDRLLPNKTVKLGEDWRVPNDVLAALLGVEAIESNTLRLTLTSIVDDFAEVELYLQGDPDAQGNPTPSTLVCASEGASVAIDLEGRFQFDLKARRLTWFGVRVDERRSESVAAPGLEWSATLQINVAPLDAPQKLTDAVVADLRGPIEPELLRLYYNAQKGFWRFQHSRDWKMTQDGETSASLCYVVGGEAIAQCNIAANGKIDLESKPSIDAYKAEIKKGLGDRFGAFVQDDVYAGPSGDSIYYVVVDGSYEEIPFRWVYYLVTDEAGNQATLMFEIRADMLDNYDDSGREIVETFRIVPRVDPAAKAAAEKAAREAAQKAKEDADAPKAPEGRGIDAEKADDAELERAPSPEK